MAGCVQARLEVPVRPLQRPAFVTRASQQVQGLCAVRREPRPGGGNVSVPTCRRCRASCRPALPLPHAFSPCDYESISKLVCKHARRVEKSQRDMNVPLRHGHGRRFNVLVSFRSFSQRRSLRGWALRRIRLFPFRVLCFTHTLLFIRRFSESELSVFVRTHAAGLGPQIPGAAAVGVFRVRKRQRLHFQKGRPRALLLRAARLP